MKKNSLKFYIEFTWVFILLGLQMIGNFGALMPLLEDALVEKKSWIKKEDILDSLTWGRCGPGAAVINAIIYLGNKIAGPITGAIAAISFCIAPMCIILIIANFSGNILKNNYVTSIMNGISVAVVVRMIKANIDLGKKTLNNKVTICVCMLCTILMFITQISTIVFIIVAVVGSIIWVKKFQNRITN